MYIRYCMGTRERQNKILVPEFVSSVSGVRVREFMVEERVIEFSITV